jgi:catechol 2,3-dioxygenase
VIHPATAIGSVHLTVSDLRRSVAFYVSQLGMTVRERNERTASLGAGGPDLLVLSESNRAPRVRGATGLYHFAILVPSRAELARSLRRLVETGTPLQGAADHGVSEALYLADPDGNGIEIYRDRSRDEWPRPGGTLRMGVEPLDLDGVLADLDVADQGKALALHRATTMGHVHLHVANLADAESFYAGVLGFDVMQRYGSGALFVSAGGYHHHIGLNTWAGVGAPPAPPGALGLRYFTLRLPDESAQTRMLSELRDAGVPVAQEPGGALVHDPSGNAVLLTA